MCLSREETIRKLTDWGVFVYERIQGRDAGWNVLMPDGHGFSSNEVCSFDRLSIAPVKNGKGKDQGIKLFDYYRGADDDDIKKLKDKEINEIKKTHGLIAGLDAVSYSVIWCTFFRRRQGNPYEIRRLKRKGKALFCERYNVNAVRFDNVYRVALLKADSVLSLTHESHPFFRGFDV